MLILRVVSGNGCATRRAGRVLGERQRSHPQRQRVEQQQACPPVSPPKPVIGADHLERLEGDPSTPATAPRMPWSAQLVVGAPGIAADEAAVARPVRLPAAEGGELPVERPDRRRDEWNAQGEARHRRRSRRVAKLSDPSAMTSCPASSAVGVGRVEADRLRRVTATPEIEPGERRRPPRRSSPPRRRRSPNRTWRWRFDSATAYRRR